VRTAPVIVHPAVPCPRQLSRSQWLWYLETLFFQSADFLRYDLVSRYAHTRLRYQGCVTFVFGLWSFVMVDPFLVGRIQTLALAETRIKFEYIDEFCNLLRVERTGLRIAKQQKKLRRLLKFLNRVTSPFKDRRGHDRPMIRQQHGAVRRRVSANSGRSCWLFQGEVG
jgi:hypothetical protein